MSDWTPERVQQLALFVLDNLGGKYVAWAVGVGVLWVLTLRYWPWRKEK